MLKAKVDSRFRGNDSEGGNDSDGGNDIYETASNNDKRKPHHLRRLRNEICKNEAPCPLSGRYRPSILSFSSQRFRIMLSISRKRD